MSKISRFHLFPCVPAALWLMAGILLPVLPNARLAGWPTAIGVTVAIAIVAAMTTPKKHWSTALLLLLGIALAFIHLTESRRKQLGELKRKSVPVEIRAVITEAAYSADELQWLAGRRGYFGRLREIRENTGEPWQKCSARILLQLPQGDALEYGTIVRAHGYFEAPASALVKGEFDYRRFLLGRSVKSVFQVGQLTASKPASGWRQWLRGLYRLREAGAARLASRLEPQSASLLLAMTLGYREGINPRVRHYFIQSGIVHIFAISGLHVGIIAAFILIASKLLGIPYQWRFWMLPIGLAGYVLMTGAGPSAVRAWIMISLWAVAKALMIPLLPLNAVAAAAILILLFKPLQIIDLGFIFSFVIVSFLIIGWRFAAESIRGLQEKELWIPRKARRRQALRTIGRYLASIAAGSLIAWLASFGMVLYTQGLFIPGAILLNALIAILAWLALLGAIVKIFLELLLPLVPLLELSAWLLNFCMELLQWLARIGSSQPFSFVMIQPWLPIVLLYYGLLLVGLTGKPGNLRGGQRLLAGLLAPLLLYCGSWWRQTRQEPTLAVFWGGDTSIPALVVDPASGLPPVLINAGDYRTGQRIGAWIRSRGWNRAEAVVLTGGSGQQTVGLNKILEQIMPATIVLPANWTETDQLRLAIAALQPDGVRLRFQPEESIDQALSKLIWQPHLKISRVLPAPRDKFKLDIHMTTFKEEFQVSYLFRSGYGGELYFVGRDGRMQKLRTTYSHAPQWREVTLYASSANDDQTKNETADD